MSNHVFISNNVTPERRTITQNTKPTTTETKNSVRNKRSGTDTLKSNRELKNGDYLTSGNGVYQFALQGDGNLVVYRDNFKTAIWASNTGKIGNIGPDKLRLHETNNLVLYDKDAKETWVSRTVTDHATARTGYVKMQDDGNLVVYRGDGKALWTSGTDGGKNSAKYGTGYLLLDRHTLHSGSKLFNDEVLKSKNGLYRAMMQSDGNFVLYNTRGSNAAIWSSKSNCEGSATGTICKGSPFILRIKEDNEVVISDKDSQAIWSSGTQIDHAPVKISHLTMQDDGNLVIYNVDGKAVWESATLGGRISQYMGTGHLLVVACGGDQKVYSCYQCPKSNGSAWCSDDCYWDKADDACKEKSRVTFCKNPCSEEKA